MVGIGPIRHLCALILTMRGRRVTAFDWNSRRLSYFDGASVDTSSDHNKLSHFEILVKATGTLKDLMPCYSKVLQAALCCCWGLPYARREFSFESIVAYDRTVVRSVGSSAVDF